MSPLEHLLDAFPQDIRFVYRHFPLNGDSNSRNHFTVRAAEAAGLQGQFFEYNHLLYEKQSEWKSLQTDDELREQVIQYAIDLGLDEEQFVDDLDSEALIAKASDKYEQAVRLGLQGTPTMILNGGQLNPGAISAPEEQWASFIEAQKAIAQLPKYDPPEMTIDPDKEYSATVETEKGTFTIELFAKSAPITVNNFVFLANEGYYDGVTFHRVIEDFMAQTGDPSGTGMGDPGYTFEDEIDENLEFDGPGWVAMANSGPGTNGSQWFVTYAPATHLNGAHTIFGKVSEGMDVVESLTPRDPSQSPDFEGDKILSITIEVQ